MNLCIHHNPRCAKSREALALMQSAGHSVEVIDYQKTPPSVADLQALLSKLALPARELLRSAEDAYKDLDLGRPELSDAELLAAIAAHPIWLQRPIVESSTRAVIARSP